MSERQELLLLLALIYGAECFRWVRRGGSVFRRTWGSQWRLVERSEFLANERGDLHWTWPLPGFGDFLVARGRPWAFGPLGVATFPLNSRHPQGRVVQPLQFRAWSEVRSVGVEGQEIRVAGKPWWTADTHAEAVHLADGLRKWAVMDPPAREAELEQSLKAAFDLAAIRARLQETDSGMKQLRRGAAGLWWVLFGLLPASVWKFGWFPALPILLVGAYAGSIWLSRRGLRFLREWYPEAKDERFKLGLMLGLSPVTAIRSADLVGRSRLETFEPLAVLLALVPMSEAGPVAAAWARDAEFPRIPENPFPPDSPAATTVAWFAERYRREVVRVLGAAGLDPAMGRASPQASEAGNTHYCARCSGQFQSVATHCHSCGGRPLFPLPQSQRVS